TTSHGLSATDGLSSGVAARGDASAATPADPRPAVVTDAATSAADSRAAREAARLARLRQAEAAITWRRAKAVGRPNRGRLVDGVRAPGEGGHCAPWDPALDKVPTRGGRRNGADEPGRLVLRVAAEYAADHPDAPRLVVGDLS